MTTVVAAALALASCGGNRQRTNDPLADTGRTQRTENLLTSLHELAGEGKYMFGHQDSPMYGVGWQGDENRSDVKSVCGDMPAVMGFDLGHLELGDSLNLDGVPFSRMREEIIRQFDRGGMVTLSWHLDNPLSGGTAWVSDSLRSIEQHTVASVLPGGERHEVFLGWLDAVADFLCSLETDYGVRVPVLFRPWHEHSGSWFWWGEELCSADEYKSLWQLTVSHLRERGVDNVLYAYAPGTESDGDADRYMARYPGDDIIDVLGLDTYCGNPTQDSTAVSRFATQLDRHLSMICQLAQEHGKVAALTETGQEALPTTDWWTTVLAPVLERHAVSYVLVWRNAHNRPHHFFAPYPGQSSASDFVRFYNDPRTLFLRDVNGLYLK